MHASLLTTIPRAAAAWFLCAALLSPAPAQDAAEDDTASAVEQELDLDALDEPAGSTEEDMDLDALDDGDADRKKPARSGHPGGHPGGLAALKDRFSAGVMVDFNWDFFIGPDGGKENSFGSNHEYVLLTFSPVKTLRLSMEILALTYWDLRWQVGRRTALKFGKLALPFSPLVFHQLYGGIVEKPLAQGQAEPILVPRDWTEYGIEVDNRWVDEYGYGLDTKVWVSNGLNASYSENDIRAADGTVRLTSDIPARDRNLDKAIGLRINNTFAGGVVRLGLSGYTCKWAPDLESDSWFAAGDRVWLGNVDVTLGYGFIPAPVLKRLRLMGAFAVLTTQSTYVNRTSADSWIDYRVPSYVQHASYVEATVQVRTWLDLQYRFGMYDDNTVYYTSRDLINHNVAVYIRPNKYITIVPRYYRNMERVNEAQDDYFLLKAVVQL